MLSGSQPDCLTDSKGFSDNPSHFAMRSNGVVQGMAEAVALSPAAHPVFDKAVFERNHCGAIHKDARAAVWHVFPFPKTEAVRLPKSAERSVTCVCRELSRVSA